MATEKILIFDEAGNAKRMKVRIARFLDNEPVTASDKTNIRTTLDVDDSLSGTFTTPLSVTSASDSSFTGGGKLHISESSGATIRLESTTPTLQTGGVLGAIEFETQDAGSEGVNAKINSVFENTVGATSLQFFTSEAFTTVPAAPRWTINSTGNLVAGANLGIDFGSGSTLDAYELGTHTTTMAATTSGSIALDSSNDRLGYAIIGDQVFITGRLVISSVTSPTGLATFTLPTTPKNMTEGGGYGGNGATYYDFGTNTWSVVPVNWSEGSSTVYINMDASILAANDQFRFSLTYQSA